MEEWERDGALDMELAREGEAVVGDIGLVVESWDEECLRLRLLMLEAGEAFAPHCKETVLMPLLVLVLAGITSVTRPSGPGMISLLGWLMLHPALSCVPFE